MSLSLRIRPLSLVVALLFGGLIGGWTFYLARSEGELRTQTRFQKLLSDRAATVESRMHSSLETLHFLAALYNSSEEVTREEFATFTQVALGRHPEIEVVTWAPRVTAAGRPEHVAGMQARVDADYEIRDWLEDGELGIAPPRGEYFPVIYAEPRARATEALGVDLAHEPQRRRALHRAVTSGSLQVTDPVQLAGSTEAAMGLLALLPVWQPATAMATLQERLDRLLGVTVLAWNVEALAAAAVREDPADTYRDLSVELRATEGAGGWLPLAVGGSAPEAAGVDRYGAAAELTVAGRRIRLTAAQGPAFIAASSSSRPLLLGLLTFFVAGCAASCFLSWLQRGSEAKDDRLKHLTTAVAQSADVIFITDRGGRFLYVNQGFEQTTGYTSDEVLGKTPRILRSGLYGSAHYRMLWRTILGGEVHRGTIANRRKNGTVWYGEQSITPIKDHDGNVMSFVSVTKDMTERMLLHEREAEVRLAAIIQQGLYPPSRFRFGGLDLAGAAFPVGDACGDYYDLIPMPDGTLAMAIGDVSGHGIGPALIMVAVRARLRSWLTAGSSIAEAVTFLNEVLCKETPDDSFVSLMLARVDPRAGKVTYVNAGHPQGFVVAADGLHCAEMPQTGPALAIMPGAGFAVGGPIDLRPGDVIALMTDGILEAQSSSGELFDSTRVWSVLQQHRREPAREILAALHASAGMFAADEKPQDDLALLIGKATTRGAAEDGGDQHGDDPAAAAHDGSQPEARAARPR